MFDDSNVNVFTTARESLLKSIGEKKEERGEKVKSSLELARNKKWGVSNISRTFALWITVNSRFHTGKQR